MNTLDILIQRLAEQRDQDPRELAAILAPTRVTAVVAQELSAARCRAVRLADDSSPSERI